MLVYYIDQAIRNTIAEWEGRQTGIDLREEPSLEEQFRQMRNTRRLALEDIARRKLEIIEAEAREKPDADQLKELNRKLQAEAAELKVIERKLRVISESMEQLRGNETTAAIPVMIISASANHDDQERAMSMGVEAYLSKPYRAGKLISMVEDLLLVN